MWPDGGRVAPKSLTVGWVVLRLRGVAAVGGVVLGLTVGLLRLAIALLGLTVGLLLLVVGG